MEKSFAVAVPLTVVLLLLGFLPVACCHHHFHPMNAPMTSAAWTFLFALFQPEADYVMLRAKETPGLENLQMMSSGLFLDSFITAIGDAGEGPYFAGPAVVEGETYESLHVDYRT
jgi:hypothetical protein